MNPIQPYPSMPYRPMLPMAPQPPADPTTLVSRLGMEARLGVDGQAQYNEPLVQNIVTLRESALPALNLLLRSTNTTTTILEALHTATKMAESGVSGVEKLYSATAHLNNHIDPAVQVQLARFYGKINEPKAIGPILNTAIHYATNQYPMGSQAAYQFTEAAGEAIVNQVARRTAQETIRQLLPFLRPPANPGQVSLPTRQKPI